MQPFATAVITGGNVGLGFECARNLALKGFCVLLACRNTTAAEEAAARLRSETNNQAIIVVELDLASLDSVRQCAAHIKSFLQTRAVPPLRVLVNNAGVQMGAELVRTQEGHEISFGVNHLGHFLLTYLLCEHFVTPARIVNVASEAHDPSLKLLIKMPPPYYRTAEQVARGEMNTTHPNKIGQMRYSTSKLCNVLATYAFADFFAAQQREITVTAFNPGMMPGTALARNYDAFSRFAWNYILPATRFFDPNVRSVAQSGSDLAELATHSSFEGKTAVYFNGTKQTPSSVESYDKAKQRDLWETSMRMCGLA
jgi:NAD(P)-dependent dehydrogenase (short-subunit alcohol dehydrogenase family)